MDASGQIYELPTPAQTEKDREDAARLDGYLIARAEQDRKRMLKKRSKKNRKRGKKR